MAIIPCNDPAALATGGQQISTDDFPAAADVKKDVTYGPYDYFTGTYDPGGGAAPDAPTIAVSALTTTSVRITIDGDAGTTHYAFYATGLGGAWNAGGNREGDGNIDIADLTAGATYYFQVYSVDSDYYSAPSVIEGLTLAGEDVLTTTANLLEESLAASVTFRTWTETENAEAAKERIHQWEVDEEGLVRPLALITPGENYEAERTAFGTGDWHRHRGELRLTLEAAFDTEETVAANVTIFSLSTGKIIQEVLAVSGRGGYLAIERLERIDGPGMAHEDAKERIIAETYSVNWD